MPEALDYVKLFNGLKNGEPLKVLYTQDFLDIMGSFEELERLAEAGQRIPLVVVEDKKLPEPGLEEEFRLLPPLQNIPVQSGPKTADTISFSRDGVSRRIIMDLEDQPLLHMNVARLINGKNAVSDYRGVFEYKRT